MSSARALLLLVALCACATAAQPGNYGENGVKKFLNEYDRQNRSLEAGRPTDCSADAQEPCLRCSCASAAMMCSRRACAPPPEEARHCKLLHHPGSCCPDLYCPNGVVINTELDVDLDERENVPVVTASALANACHEDGRTYLSGSAMPGGVACAECFCVRGARRCVAPSCLPPPQHCTPLPAAGLCCPAGYSCSHPERGTTAAPATLHYDCTVDGKVVPEGSRVPSPEPCSRCFCLRGVVRCGALDCARALPGCVPVVPPGHCCARHYNCSHTTNELAVSNDLDWSDNALTASFADRDRSFRSVESSETTTTPPKDERTNKVKRKANDTAPAPSTTAEPTTSEKTEETTVTEKEPESSTPTVDTSMRIMINGTINCTSSISSSPIPMNTTTEKKEEQTNQSKANMAVVSALGDDDIITEREPESFTVRVTSALHAAPPAPPAPPAMAAIPTAPAHNASDDYDYHDYVEPTLPPSLPNLKIIPFVAADAVVEKEDLSPKEAEYPSLQILEREDKFPVYYPAPAPPPPAPAHAQRRQDVLPPAPRPAAASSALHKPSVNLFSPPMETEGGFIPKAPGLSGEYFAVYPPRPGLPMPHLTTSMQLGTVKDDEISLTTPTPSATTTVSSTTTTESQTIETTTVEETTSPPPTLTSPEPLEKNEEKIQNNVTTASDSTVTSTDRATPTVTKPKSTTAVPPINTTAATSATPTAPQYNGSLEYEEEEDEGFSFGSVLKLLLSESYDAPTRKPPPSTPRPTVAPFVPLPPRPTPPRKTAAPLTPSVDRIDHLVLGEATAIRRPTPTKPAPPPPPPPTRRPVPSTRKPDPTTPRPLPPKTEATTRRPAQTNPPAFPPPVDAGGIGPGGLKLAGCNIYGRMYRVGRIIAELSGACQECRCTDTGVQCRALPC